MQFTKSINYIFINSYQGFPIFLTGVDVSPKNSSDVKMNIKGKIKDCYFEDGILTFASSRDAPQEDTTLLYLIYEV